MRPTSKVSATLAAFLFISQAPVEELAGDRDRTLALIHQTADLLGPDGAKTALAETAYAYGDHPETAVPRMAACVKAVETLPIKASILAPRTAVIR